ncbi:hypothetical protein PYW08_015765 [Mythimna loreyi]|uniref:Uncharacterized protein n=1 Tax=Mythimna loreyi TaxID=667449 RepID=A0ACC2QSR4_9NEOP|nr:hypothetical protein PYW08_015765 [Mythimna loreyi]
MGLCKGINSMRLYLIFAVLSIFAYSIHAESPFKKKSQLVQDIIKKVSNLTMDALSKAPHETKETILKKIENRLRQSASAIGPDADKYISFIMKQFKTKMTDSIALPKVKSHSDNVAEKNDSLIRRTKVEEGQGRKTIDSKTKKEIVQDIANKIQTLAKGFMKHAESIESKQQILEKIKKRIMDSTKEKHIQLHNKHTELKTYSGLIAQGLEESMRKMLESEGSGRRADSQPLAILESESIPVAKDKPENTTKLADDIIKKTMTILNLEEINKYRELISQSLKNTSVDQHCEKIVENTCTSVQSINQIPCGVGKFIPVENLCNNITDCLDGVDEKNCVTQAMEIVRKATKVMSEVESSMNRKCFTLTEESLLMSQNQVLRDVLYTQMDFLKKHVKPSSQEIENKSAVVDEKFVKGAVNDVSRILSTLSYALDGALCARSSAPEHYSHNDFRRFNDIDIEAIEGLDDIPKDVGWTPKLCRCKRQFCIEPTCQAACKRVCWQRFSLNHWGCQALSGTTFVSLNVVCDGKLDCFDETDENFCKIDGTSSKFEAAKSYSNLLDLLTTKSKSKVFKSRNKLLALHSLVRSLQKHTTRTNTDSHTVKALRDEAFNLLVAIYDDLLETDSLDELEDHYFILLTINEKLVTALKGSHTGNENLISAEGCYCRDGLCALRRCNKHCIQACLAEPLLSKFSCNDVKNLTIPIESVCNGVKNCPTEEDEKNCTKDICRGHHLVMLRRNLENVGLKHKSSVMGEVIDTWKAKVTAYLVVVENAQRTTHRVMVETVHRVLQDLVVAFAAMEDYRRSNSDYALQEFKGIAKIVMQTLKSCTH